MAQDTEEIIEISFVWEVYSQKMHTVKWCSHTKGLRPELGWGEGTVESGGERERRGLGHCCH